MGFRDEFYRIETFTEKVARVFVPFGIAFLVLIFLSLFFGYSVIPKLLSIYGFYSIPFIDAIPAFILGIKLGLNYYVVSFWLITTELCSALFVAWNFDYLYKIKVFRRLVKKGRMKIFEKYSWVFKFRMFTLSIITLLPIAASGSFISPIVGRMFGLSVGETLFGIVMGSIARFSIFILLVEAAKIII